MLRRLAALALVLLLAATACGEDAPPGAAGDTVRIDPAPTEDPTGQADWLLDFGTLEAGKQAVHELALRNTGDTPLPLARLPLLAPFAAEPAEGASIAPGETLRLRLRFEPPRAGTWQTLLPITLGETTRWARLRGDAIPPPAGACEIRAVTARVGFGVVGQRASVLEHVRLHNASDYACSADLTIEGDGSFRAPAKIELLPREQRLVPVTLKPVSLGALSSTLHVAAPESAAIAIALEAEVVRRCVGGPAETTFGSIAEGCWSDEALLEIGNACTHPVRILDVRLEGDAGDFRITSRPILPAVIPASDDMLVGLRYTPWASGPSAGVLRVVDDAGDDLEVALDGDGSPRETTNDFDRQGTLPDADRLYVVDDGTEMEALAARIAAWGATVEAELENVDGRVGITTTSRTPTEGCAGSGADGRLVPIDGSTPRVLDRPELLDGRLADRLPQPACSAAPSEAFAAAARAVTELAARYDDPAHPEEADGNLRLRRAGVPLQIVFVAARDDASEGSLQAWIDHFAALQERHDLAFAAILTDRGCGTLPLGHRIEALVRALGGDVRQLCTDTVALPWAKTVPSWPFRTRFQLTEVPLDRNRDGAITEADDGFAVLVDGEPVPQRAEDGDLRWEVLPNVLQVEFARAHAPGEGQRVDFVYLPVCPTDGEPKPESSRGLPILNVLR